MTPPPTACPLPPAPTPHSSLAPNGGSALRYRTPPMSSHRLHRPPCPTFISFSSSSSTTTASMTRLFYHAAHRQCQWLALIFRQQRNQSPNVSGRHLSFSTARSYTSTIYNRESSPNPPKPDPTAKRPTQKCDPYGLSGASLSYQQCIAQHSTLEPGWTLTDAHHTDLQGEEETPIHLEKTFYHETFYTASRFASQITLLCTNVNHYPEILLERVLVDDVNEFYNANKVSCIDNTDGKRRKIQGWVFTSTIRCSSYRPALKKKEIEEKNASCDKGLTFHDFHLAMNIDVESNREELGQLLLKKMD